MIKIRVDKFILDSGERYCIVINKESGIPLYYPNLYLTTRFRNTGHAVSTIESKAVNLSLFYRFLENNNINIESNIFSGLYLSGGDIDRLITYLSRVSDLRKNMNLKSNDVSKRTLCHRLDSIIDYLSWLTEELLQYDLSKCGNYLYKFIKSIKIRKPMYHKNKYSESNHLKTLSDNAINEIMEMIDYQSPKNPFKPIVRNRNAIIIQVLSELSIRGGELLNIKIEDINFQKKRLYIRRRADDISDSRLNQPLVKTLARLLPLSNKLASDLKSYIDCDRKFFAKDKTGFLFITYKSGPFRGEPLSISGYHKIISKIGDECHLLKRLTGHQFRHTWNYKFSCLMDLQDVSEREQEQMREKLMGWKEGSGTASIYNKRFVEEKAHEASIRLQNRLHGKSGEIKNDK
ncbi:tyrosine-type recombinase/integrase [Pectobacterium carotovorum]|uniref:tyrosine-type recombinase/integrase n=1 Tax=Pectobacterium carotovorum TaxID=554 RepID=UPI001886BCA9|nr:site-specific integrase [Pectobacterium carotovorum]MBG0752213.1 hypothetical protein [Pectobacterium carotovorum subsp. carotovorum PCCS1]